MAIAIKRINTAILIISVLRVAAVRAPRKERANAEIVAGNVASQLIPTCLAY